MLNRGDGGTAGAIYVVGLGPGNPGELTPRAREAIAACDIVVGYSVYVDIVRAQFPEKETSAFPMKKEIDRCQYALALAEAGRRVAVVSSGDPGVYGMAGLMLEVARASTVAVEIVPGISACCSAAAVLGAPLTHDFAVVSLSDLLTPWEKIERRLDLAAQADFVICLYNPASRKRSDYLARACDIVLRSRTPSTPAAWVRMAGRDGQTYRISTLGELRGERLDMFCTVFIGNSLTKAWGGPEGRIATPRGYPLADEASETDNESKEGASRDA